MAVPALVDGLPTDGASGSVSGSSSRDALNSDAGTAAVAGGDLQLTALRAAEEGRLQAGSDVATAGGEGTAQLRQFQRLRLYRMAATDVSGSTDGGVRVGSNVLVGDGVHVGIAVDGESETDANLGSAQVVV